MRLDKPYTVFKKEGRGNFLLLILLLVGLFSLKFFLKPQASFEGMLPAPTTPTSTILLGQKIPINIASKELLEVLPGVGEKTAEKIIAYRPYKKTEDLLKVPGLGKNKLKQIQPYLRVD